MLGRADRNKGQVVALVIGQHIQLDSGAGTCIRPTAMNDPYSTCGSFNPLV
ncbi:hypothetical protein [Caldilinea sp.]|uniref:hypothetical protein n=1 Tax=Caldilinea sp. TaxID=2293560 RepID=UPI002BAC7765|nr:hypothetical protein [Anaerolineales bacterium]HQY91886.1 hypothetical protein [Caldilinea sp.]HRA68702.1 hypothetical protein [Caldilinea sp.]